MIAAPDFSTHPRDEVFRYLALGGGVQSSALFLMACLGLREIPRPHVAIFADTQDEPAWVYKHLDFLKEFGEEHGLPLVVTTKGRLSDHVLGKLRGERRSAPGRICFSATDASTHDRQSSRCATTDGYGEERRGILGKSGPDCVRPLVRCQSDESGV